MSNILTDILESKRREIAELPPWTGPKPPRSDRDFAAALRGRSRTVIAEIKRRSPSEGPLCNDFHPATVAERYQQGGAAAVSVLTDARFFGGHFDHLTQVRNAVRLPVLRKDFIIDPRQIVESRSAGADACLLIVAALSRSQLSELSSAIRELGMTPLVEVHTEHELVTAIEVGCDVIGVNSRDLSTLQVDTNTIQRLLPMVPDDVILIAESGLTSPEQIARLPDRVNGVLIGTALMRSPDPVAFLRKANRLTERVE